MWYDDILGDVVDGARDLIGAKFDAEVGRTVGDQIQQDSEQRPTENVSNMFQLANAEKYYTVAGTQIPKLAVWISGGFLAVGVLYKVLD